MIVNLPQLYTKQHEAFWCPDRYSVTEAATKAGKTVGAIAWQCERVMRCTRHGNHWWIAPIYAQAEIAYTRAARMFKGMCKTNKTSLKLTFPNGAVWWFKSAEKPDNLYGEDVYSVVFDEFTRAREEAWYAIRSTITATEAPVRFIGNVSGRGWGYRLARKAESGEQGWAYHIITAADAVEAGVLEAKEIEDAERTLPRHIFRELYFCEPSDDGGNPFGIQHIDACTIDTLSDEKPVVFGIDLARKVDWTVIVGLDEYDQVCYFDRWQRVPWSETIKRIVSVVGESPALVDATGVGDPVVEQLGKDYPNFEPFVFTSKSKQALMEGLSVAIQSHEVGFPDGQIKVELECFEYKLSGSGYSYSAPTGLHDDCVMALALAVRHSAEVGCGGPMFGRLSLQSVDEPEQGWESW